MESFNNQQSRIAMQGGSNYGEQTFNFNAESAKPLEPLRKDLTLLPAKKKHFIGRKKELQQIEEALANEGILYIVNGIGGIGKSELVEQYLLTHQQDYQHTASFAFSAENNDLRNTLYQVLKRYFYIDKESDTEQLIHRLQGLPKKCLFIFDDLQDKETIKQLEPLHHNADVLITTRLTIAHKSSLNLEVLNPNDAKALFLEYYPTNEAIDDILEFVDYHTLFIELIAKTLAEDCLDLITLRDQINSGEFTRIERDFDRTFNDFLVQRFKIETHTGLKSLLKHLALLPAFEIPYQTLATIFADTPRLDLTLKELVKRGWLAEKENSYKLHQIIKEFILANHPLDFEQEIVPVIDNLITIESIDNKTLYSDILKSLYAICPQQPHEKVAELLTSLAGIYENIGDYRRGIFYQKKVVRIKEALLGDKNIEMATAYNNLALLYELQGNYVQSLPLLQKALAINEKILGAEHPNTAKIYNNLAALYCSQGDFVQALPLHQKALTIREKILDAEHPDTAVSYNNLAELYRSQGDSVQALPLSQKALSINEKILGAEHPDTAVSHNNLGLIYQLLDDYVKALPLCQKALTINEKILGTEHPDTATNYNNLAHLQLDLKNYHRAKYYAEKALKAYQSNDPKKRITNVLELLKDINSNIKEAKKLPLKRRRKYCKD